VAVVELKVVPKYQVVQEVLVEDQLEVFQEHLLQEQEEQQQHVKVMPVVLVLVQIMETLVVVELVQSEQIIQVQ
tara:strand:+ start:201 stop:422 length:222 start_codon:yes stop_codon:yes gene_type:complete